MNSVMMRFPTVTRTASVIAAALLWVVALGSPSGADGVAATAQADEVAVAPAEAPSCVGCV